MYCKFFFKIKWKCSWKTEKKKEGSAEIQMDPVSAVLALLKSSGEVDARLLCLVEIGDKQFNTYATTPQEYLGMPFKQRFLKFFLFSQAPLNFLLLFLVSFLFLFLISSLFLKSDRNFCFSNRKRMFVVASWNYN